MKKDIATIDNNEYQQWLQHFCAKIDTQRLKVVTQLKQMRQFADEYPDFPFVQVPLAQLQQKPFLKARLA